MFSAKVIIAIEALLRMEWGSGDDAVSQLRQGTDLSELFDRGGMHKSTCRAVVRQLMQSGYISFTGNRNCYVALRDPAQITVMQLVRLFHGDICLGEIYDHTLTMGRLEFESVTFSNLSAYEKRLRQWLSDSLESTPITKFRFCTAPLH